MIVIMVCLTIPLMVVRLYMYINPFIEPAVTGFGVPFEVMEHTNAYDKLSISEDSALIDLLSLLIPELEGFLCQLAGKRYNPAIDNKIQPNIMKNKIENYQSGCYEHPYKVS